MMPVSAPVAPPVVHEPGPATTAPPSTQQDRIQTIEARQEPPLPPVRDITELIASDDLHLNRNDAPQRGFEDERVEAKPQAKSAAAKKKRAFRLSGKLAGAIAAAVVAVAAVGYFAMRKPAVASDAGVGTLDVQSSPAGVQVFIDGEDRGQTPARLSLKPGAHILELRGRGVPRVIPVNVTAGGQVSQYLEFADTPSTGQLQVQSQPAGARVSVDGVDRGAAPVTVSNLSPGDHEVVLKSDAGTARQVVSVQAGATASLVAPVGGESSAGPVSGWVLVEAPVSMEIREGGKLIGTSDADRLMLAAGRHDLEIGNEMLGYRVTRVVQVPPGKVAPIKIDLPNGVVNLNAAPWAEVWIDGKRVGETPIGNLSVPIGPHEVVFRNPQLGEKRHAISVSLAAPVRVSIDMK
jgi:hypothetical protein